MNVETRHEHEPEFFSWEKLAKPLTLGFADESGAVLADEAGKTLWYLDVNDMSYRKLAGTDLSENRRTQNVPYDLKEGTAYENGAIAAMSIRKTHLEEQLKVLDAMKGGKGEGDAVRSMIEDLTEELGYVKAYLTDEDPKERSMITKELNEMYADMRSEEAEITQEVAAAAK